MNDVELGFISNFGNGNFFEAEKGKGCWLNNEEVHPSNTVNISDITLGGFTKSGTSAASHLVDNARRMRVLGSVVLEISYVASGRYDAFIDLRGSRIIDIAASKLILEEAGCIITDKYDIEYPFMITQSRSPHALAIDVFSVLKSLSIRAVQTVKHIAAMLPIYQVIGP